MPVRSPPRPTTPAASAGTAADALAAWIGASGLEPGARLPAERELMTALGVGRSTLREAIGRLGALGALESRRGSGTYLVRAVGADTVWLPLSVRAERDALLETLEVRRALETEAAALAAARADAAAVARIREAYETLEAVELGGRNAGAEDLAFHREIYAASGNPLFEQLLSQMRDAFESFWHRPFRRDDFGTRSFGFHGPLAEAIAAGDVEGARRQTASILDSVREDIVEMASAAEDASAAGTAGAPGAGR